MSNQLNIREGVTKKPCYTLLVLGGGPATHEHQVLPSVQGGYIPEQVRRFLLADARLQLPVLMQPRNDLNAPLEPVF
jgi:hypothetical protein